MRTFVRFGLGGMGLLLVALSPSSFAAVVSPPADPAAEVRVAYERLHAQPYRKREITLMTLPTGRPKGAQNLPPVVTEVVGDRTRMVFEMSVPQHGQLRTEQVTVSDRRATRTIAPGILAMIEKTRRRVTVNATRSILQQAISILTAVQTGGLSTHSAISNLVNAAATLKTTADARRALDQAAAAFGEWQLVPENGDEEDLPTFDDSADMIVEFVGEETLNGRAMRSFRRRPEQDFGMGMEERLLIDAATGLPAAEEMHMGGRPMVRVEYFDIGADITIELPAVLAAD